MRYLKKINKDKLYIGETNKEKERNTNSQIKKSKKIQDKSVLGEWRTNRLKKNR